MARDPVCGAEVDPLRARAVAIVGGRTLYFCSAAHKEQYIRDVSGPVVDPAAAPPARPAAAAPPPRPAPTPPPARPAAQPRPAPSPAAAPPPPAQPRPVPAPAPAPPPPVEPELLEPDLALEEPEEPPIVLGGHGSRANLYLLLAAVAVAVVVFTLLSRR
jgi:YHS domain-containing protein